ncbi:MAG: DUF11 domain-containing protein [Thermoplasmatales archaeon]|nr:MAG: DUF11 domain-containing protein [Thermoplasmatales archaeon]
MKTKIICILVMTLLITSTAISVTGAINVEKNDVENIGSKKLISNFLPFPLQFSFDVEAASGGLGNAGAEFAYDHFYSTRWASNLLHEYTSGGVLTKQFSIPGVSGLRDLAYCPVDNYLYGGAAGGTIWGFDPAGETLEETINGNFQCRAIAYDDNLDVFYVSNWGDPVWVVDRTTGNILSQFDLNTTTSTYGFAYEDECNSGVPYLWVFDQGGSGAVIHQWDLTAGGYTGVTHDVAADFPASAGIAGGLFFTTEFISGTGTLGGLLQGTPDIMFCYEICEVCEPSIDVEKEVWDNKNQEWVDADTRDEALDVCICNEVTFKITVTNTGTCPLYNVKVSDIMHDSLKYISADPDPFDFWYEEPYYYMIWYIDEMDETQEVVIYITAHVEGPECSYDVNHVEADGVCLHGTPVFDEDDCWVHAKEKAREFNTPILDWLQNHPNLFPLLQKLIKLLGL